MTNLDGLKKKYKKQIDILKILKEQLHNEKGERHKDKIRIRNLEINIDNIEKAHINLSKQIRKLKLK